MEKKLVIVTGKNGQLGWELMQQAPTFNEDFDFVFVDREELDLSNPSEIAIFFQKHTPAYFINCGAYTAVDRAETEKEVCMAINATSVGEIAKACATCNCLLVTISTDYVFNGNGTKPYTPYQTTEPLNFYGESKAIGEQLALKNNPNKTIIIRTSWVYSVHGANFVKTMLRLMKEKESLNIVSDQIGSPTYAKDLATALLQIILQLKKGLSQFGIYHFSNSGIISWFQFAEAIKEIAGLACQLNPVNTSAYPTPAKRPAYSVLDKQSIESEFKIELIDWKESLKNCMQLLENNTKVQWIEP
jgi:dTDP-4-dehydrorhamnose reductase